MPEPLRGPACSLAALALLATASILPAAEPTPLTAISAIRGLSPDRAESGLPVLIRGTVTYLNEAFPSGMIVHDGEAGQFVIYTEEFRLTQPGLEIRRGDRVEVDGRTARGGFAPNVIPERVRRLGPGRIPEPRHLTHSAMRTGRHDCDYVEVRGVGQRAWLSAPMPHTLFLEIGVEGGTVRATFWDFRPDDLERFVDARIRVRGNAGALFGEAGQLRGVSLLAGRTDEIVVDEAAPAPFSLPVRSIASLFAYSTHGEVDRRVRVRGVVTYQSLQPPVEVLDVPTSTQFNEAHQVVYLADESGAVRVESAEQGRLAAGDVVDVAGFPTLTPTKPTIQNAVLRRLDEVDPPPPRPVEVGPAASRDEDAELVRVAAQLLGQIQRPTERVLVLQSGETAFEAVLASSPAAASLDALRTGSRILATGVYSFQPGPPPSFRLLMRSPADVVVTREAPWWTTRHTLVVTLIVGLLGSAAGLWVRVITTRNRLAEERYKAVFAERTRLARELHDTLEQGLAGINLQLEAVAGSLEDSPGAARRSLGVAREMLRYSMDEARRSVMDLRSPSLEDDSLPGALQRLASRMTLGTPLVADIRVEGPPRPLPPAQEHHLLRIGLEALANAVKHAGASRVEIGLRFRPATVELSVRDDGRGFEPPAAPVSGEHFGLRGIRERADKLGAELELESAPRSGTRLTVRVPATARPPAS